MTTEIPAYFIGGLLDRNSCYVTPEESGECPEEWGYSEVDLRPKQRTAALSEEPHTTRYSLAWKTSHGGQDYAVYIADTP